MFAGAYVLPTHYSHTVPYGSVIINSEVFSSAWCDLLHFCVSCKKANRVECEYCRGVSLLPLLTASLHLQRKNLALGSSAPS